MQESIVYFPKKIVLIGHPNVGKSAVFTRLTSRYVSISNYPGTTVEVSRGRTQVGSQVYEVLDTPGVRSVFATSGDEHVTLEVLWREKPDLIVQVADAKNLRGALLLTAQLSQLRVPMILDLNMDDERRERGIQVDCERLAERLGIPVVQTVATRDEGFDGLRQSFEAAAPCSLKGLQPVEWIEDIVADVLEREDRSTHRLTSQATLLPAAVATGAILHLENYAGPLWGWPTLYGLSERLFTSMGLITSAAAAVICAFLLPVLLPILWALHDRRFNEHFGRWARKPISGLFILAVTLSLMYQFVGNLGAQSLVAILEDGLFASYLTPLLQGVLAEGFLFDLLVGPYGLVSMGLAYGLAIVLPVVSTFFLAFSFLEDSGYLPRLSILSDRLLRLVGLNGKAFLPMILGFGCVTMATMTTRILNTRKERIIATVLLALGIPCSAQLGVILGIISGISTGAAGLVFGTVLLQLVVVGVVMGRLLPGRRSPFILELPPIRYPLWSNILRKTAVRVKWFLREALPLFILGTFVLFLLDRLYLLDTLIGAAQPVVSGLLDLPRRTAAVFFMGFLRRDYGAAGLFDMARQGELDLIQTVVSLTVMTLFVPCLANFFVLIKEHGLKVAAGIAGFITGYSVAVGAVPNLLLRWW